VFHENNFAKYIQDMHVNPDKRLEPKFKNMDIICQLLELFLRFENVIEVCMESPPSHSNYAYCTRRLGDDGIKNWHEFKVCHHIRVLLYEQ
jgi:hypothetical protein